MFQLSWIRHLERYVKSSSKLKAKIPAISFKFMLSILSILSLPTHHSDFKNRETCFKELVSFIENRNLKVLSKFVLNVG